MNTASRLELIRAKARGGAEKTIVTTGRGMAVAETGAPSAVKPNAHLPPSGGYWRCQGIRMKGRTVAGHVTALEVVPEAKEWRPSHRHTAHPLTRIAEKLKRNWH